MKFEEGKDVVLKLFSNKKFCWGLTIVLFLIILSVGVNIRMQPILTENLIDPTTGDYTPLALDPYYFLRVSETLIQTDGNLPDVDAMRYQGLDSGWATEITPMATIVVWNIVKMFNGEATLNYANVFSPVLFFAMGLIVFFLLSLLLTKSKSVSVAAAAILAVIPPYLYRTLAGFSDHEAIGMVGMFLALLSFAFGMIYLDRRKHFKKWELLGVGLLSGLFTLFAAVGWGGGAVFLFMILPFAFLARWVTLDKKNWNHILFYASWVVGVFVGGLIFNQNIKYIISRYMLSNTGILTLVALGYVVFEMIILKNKVFREIKIRSELLSIGAIVVFGGIFYQIFVGNFFGMLIDLIGKIIYPFGVGRVGLTIAENKQPYLSDLIGQVGKTVFYSFLAGCGLVGIKIGNGIRKANYRFAFIGGFLFFVFGILFSRISSTSILNGENFVSKALFFISFLVLVVTSIYAYVKSEWKVETRWIFIAAWMIPMLLAVRSAVRVFFAIVPFMAMMVPLVVYEIFNYGRKSKEDVVRISFVIASVALVALLVGSCVTYYESVSYQASAQTPSYNSNWQNAMEFVRENTTEGGIFLHWWDYGYWVQTGGDRPTVTDGGHFNGYWDHLVGRYVLTTPYPWTAKSFMKAHNVSYLLIDPSDIGKYSAYSSIGDDLEVSDRASYIATFTSDPSEIRETANGTIRIYQGGIALDDDLVYNIDGRQVLLPSGKAAIGAVILEKNVVEGGYVFEQPVGVYVYNGQQIRLPLRYLFAGNRLLDYGSGVEATAYLYANVYSGAQGQQFDAEGAVMYLSAKTKDSLVAKLYLMGDPDNEYPELELVYSESAYPFPFYYGGYQGPLNIYQVNLDEMDDIIAREEFNYPDGEYGELDDLEFVKNG